MPRLGLPVRPLREVREEFDIAGMAVSDWAALNGFKRENVYAVLAGRSKGRCGEAHRIAQALGLKPVASKASLRAVGVQSVGTSQAIEANHVEENAP